MQAGANQSHSQQSAQFGHKTNVKVDPSSEILRHPGALEAPTSQIRLQLMKPSPAGKGIRSIVRASNSQRVLVQMKAPIFKLEQCNSAPDSYHATHIPAAHTQAAEPLRNLSDYSSSPAADR